MSETLVSGFTTGAAILVLTSQVKHLFGIPLKTRVGSLKVVYVSFLCVSFNNRICMNKSDRFRFFVIDIHPKECISQLIEHSF